MTSKDYQQHLNRLKEEQQKAIHETDENIKQWLLHDTLHTFLTTTEINHIFGESQNFPDMTWNSDTNIRLPMFPLTQYRL